ncbi:MAG: glutathione synthase, partial [Gemmatimonadetes bacterium]|nr:glutathione synthase [Gemmatimonadota bacterium]
MRIAFVMDRIARDPATATTVLLAHAAWLRGHDVHLLDVLDLTCFPDGHVGGLAHIPPERRPAPPAEFLDAMKGGEVPRQRVTSAELDVLWLRQNPSEWRPDERWAAFTGILFGRMAVAKGVLVLDDPNGLVLAENKFYLERFPAHVRPRALITRSLDEVRRFYQELGAVVLKPLDGYAGQDTFLVREDATNLPIIVESLGRRGFIVVQEYIAAAGEGDLRLFVMNGEPLHVDGVHALLGRVSADGDFRGNLAAGATPFVPPIDDETLAVAAAVGPQLKRDGIFLAGLDIAGGKLLEVNTLSPGGLYALEALTGIRFADTVIRAVERKLERKRADRRLSNRELA